MPEDIVKDVGFLKVVELVGRPNEVACDKRTVSQMIEEHRIGHQPGHRDNTPSSRCHQPSRQLNEIGDAGLAEPQDVDTAQERVRRAAWQHRRLSRKQRIPNSVLLGRKALPLLRDSPIQRSLGRRFKSSSVHHSCLHCLR